MPARIARLANRLDGLRPGAGNEQDGTAFVAEGGAHGLGEVLLVRIRKQVRAVHEKYESRRGLLDLRCVEEFQTVAARTQMVHEFET